MKMKAWAVYGSEGDMIVFATTRGKARYYALGSDECEGMRFIDIQVKRCPEADIMYEVDRGFRDPKYCNPHSDRNQLYWDDPFDRHFLVSTLGWYCKETTKESCLTCCCKEDCDYFNDIIKPEIPKSADLPY